MNNLKRVLSLALASVMLIGMMVVGASAADFTDAEDIQHPEAVDILVALDIINGKEDGSYFAPADNVTRGEMAKMLAVAMKGGNDVETGTKGVPSFTDIAGHWAESYIEYCFDLGIISGRGDGTFDPNANVTGTEATKMVLTALGYDSTAYNLVGASWATRTDELARTASPSLYTDLTGVTLNVPATRDTAAMLIWNGLQNRTRRVTPSTNKSSGEVTWSYGEGDTMLKERYDGNVFVGTFVGNKDFIATGAEKGQIRVDGDFKELDDNKMVYHNSGTSTATNLPEYFPADLDIDFVGEEVKVIYRNGSRSSSAGPDKNDTIYGVFITGATKVVRTTMDKIDGVDNDDALELDDVEYDLANQVTVYRNFVGNGTTYKKNNSGVDELTSGQTISGTVYDEDTSILTLALLGDDGSAGTTADPKANGNDGVRGDAVKVTFNDSNKIEKIYITTSTIGLVTSVSGDRVTITTAGEYSVGTIKKSENDIYDDVAKDDIVVVTTLYDTADATSSKAFSTVTKAESVTGTFQGYKYGTGTQENVVVDGTTYKIRHKLANPYVLNNATLDLSRDFAELLKNEAEVEVYLVNGYVGAVKKIDAKNTNYSVVTQVTGTGTGVNNAFDALKIEVMGPDGTKSILTLDDSSTNKVGTRTNGADVKDNTDILVGDIVTYSIKSDGKADVTIEGMVETAATGNNYVKDSKSVSVAGNTYVTSADAVVFVQTAASGGPSFGLGNTATNQGEYKAYKIRDLKDINTSTPASIMATVVTDNDGKAVAAFFDQTTGRGTGSSALYGIVTSKVGSVRIDNTNYDQWKVSANGETYLINIKSATVTANNLSFGDRSIVYFTPTADNIYDWDSDVTKTDILKVAEGMGAANDVSGDYAVKAYIKEYDAKGGIITFHTATALNVSTNTYEPVAGNTYTYSVDNDVKVFYVNAEGKTSLESGSVNEYDATVQRANAWLIYEPGAVNNVIAIIAEVDGRRGL